MPRHMHSCATQRHVVPHHNMTCRERISSAILFTLTCLSRPAGLMSSSFTNRGTSTAPTTLACVQRGRAVTSCFP